jgi:hypothetical protein
MADHIKESLGRYIESEGKEYRKPEYFKEQAKKKALKKAKK